MPHLPNDAEVADYVAKGAVAILVCFFVFCAIVLPIALALGPR
ncbi:MAG: hypothetical protein WA210_00765 [Burkholderiaceae bacterium]